VANEKKPINSSPFSRVLAVELDSISKRRQYLSDPGLRETLEAEKITAPWETPISVEDAALQEIADQKTQRAKALEMHLTGLAISGGGIRSATFALGVLQGLAELDLLRRFDYISTVSGGGYIGGWLAAWTEREGDLANVHRQLRPGRDDQSLADRNPLPKGLKGVVDAEPEPIYHLRSYSRYLAPRAGSFSPDSWSLFVIYARNLFINLLMLLPATVAVVTLVRLVVWIFRQPNRSFAAILNVSDFWLILMVNFVLLVSLSFVFNVIGIELFKMQKERNRGEPLERTPASVLWLGRTLVAVIAAGFVVVEWQWSPVLQRLLERPWVLPLLAGLLNFVFITVVYSVLFRKVLRTKSIPPIGIHRLIALVIIPLMFSAVLICWLFSIDPMSVDTEHVVVSNGVIMKMDPGANVFLSDASNFQTRLQPLGYKLLIAPFDPPSLLADKAPTGETLSESNQNALRGWEQGRFYWWPALIMALLGSYMRGVTNLFINWIPMLRVLADKSYVKDGPPFSARRVRKVLLLVGAPFVAGWVGGLLLFTLVVRGLWSWHHQPHVLATFGPPLAILLVGICTSLEIGLLGRVLEEDEREWWAKFGGLLLLFAVGWAVLFLIVLYIPWLVELAGSDVLRSSLAVGWLVSSVSGAVAGRSASTGFVIGTAKKLLTRVAPWFFFVGLLAGVSMLVSSFVDVALQHGDGHHDHWAEVALASFRSLATGCVGSALFALLIANVIDVGIFSLHNTYANRLIRAYLGASRKKKTWANRWRKGVPPINRCGAPTKAGGLDREEHPISGFDFNDDIPLVEFRTGRPSKDLNLPAYWGPFPLINTALNLTATRDLDWQDRLAESFVLSPLYCGSESTGYQPLPDDFRRDNMTLGRAVAISGAAVDPNMRHHLSAAATALLTVFNTRLGWWIENPGRPVARREISASGPWSAESPSFGGLIAKELAGQTDSIGQWVHLSDGGHFENLAAYELIRRRCRYIVVCDGGCDPGFDFDDLANLIRKCRTDFGIRIEIDTAPIQKAATGLSNWHCAVGKIHYDDVDGNEAPGILVYVKSSMTGDEPPDLQQYARREPTFPHQSTANQFFDETQFESYRALGYHVACDVLAHATFNPLTAPETANPAIFAALYDHWFPSPPELEANFDKIAESYVELQKTLRSDHNLRAFAYELYPELGPIPPDANLNVDPVDRACAELFVVNQMLRLMEKAWLAAKLDGFPEHPTNRGWLNELQRCAKSATLRKHWPLAREAFNHKFVAFCVQVLELPSR
jgi:hypothetical protein